MSLLATVLSLVPLVPQGGPDPEASPAGRTHHLGREIAATMHWTGAPWLLRATREDEENGALLQRWLAVQPGQQVCDLGCGNGYHTLPLAAAVGANGRVFAVDLQPQMLQLLTQRAQARQLANLTCIEATVDDPKLAATSCDLVLMVDVYHELSHPRAVMAKVRAALRPGGRVVLVEFRAEDRDVPIKPEHTMSKAQVVRELAALGFARTATFDGLPWQHVLAFAPAPPDARLEPRELLRACFESGDDPRWRAPFLAPGCGDVPVLAAPERARIELRAGPGGSVLAHVDAADAAGTAHECVLGADPDGRWFVEQVRPPTATRPFVAMHTGTGGGPVEAQAALVQELGFAGLAWDLADLAAARRACEGRGGDVFAAYAVLDVGAGVPARLPALQAALQALAGGPGMLWLALQHTGRAGRDPAGDAAAVAVLQQLLRDADATGVEIALYPHHGFWLETVQHAQQLCERVQHPRLGLCFNLCHFLRSGEGPDPAPALQACREHLFAVTLHGADRAGTGWDTLIRPLGEGDFDVGALLKTLDAIGFHGPIGLQGFGIRRPPREHLASSMAAWRRLQAPARDR